MADGLANGNYGTWPEKDSSLLRKWYSRLIYLIKTDFGFEERPSDAFQTFITIKWCF